MKNVMDRPSDHMKTADSLPADFKNGKLSKRNSHGRNLEAAFFCENTRDYENGTLFKAFWNATDGF